MSAKRIENVKITIAKEGVEKFTNLLQSGIEVEATTEDSVLDTIQKLEGFTTEYIDDEVQTIFLDGTAMDDITVPLEPDTKVIALSAAMPGLSGAIYRRNSIHASLRSVQHDSRESAGTSVPVKVRLKLFNAIARDRGPSILRQGVTLDAAKLTNFFSAREWLAGYIHSVLLDGETIQSADLQKMLASKQQVHLQLTSDTPGAE